MRSSILSEVEAFILSKWDETVRHCPEDSGTLIGLPYPYTIPSRKGAFQEFYYWDTYFTCLGLVHSGRTELAMNNARNLLAQVERYGYVPNGNRTYYLNRSQAPYLGPIVGLIAAQTGYESIIESAYPQLEKEYDFWTSQRQSPIGLSHYGNHASQAELREFFETVKHRLGLPDADADGHEGTAYQALAECESGWDFNSRYDRHCPDFCPIDLNTNLWLYENLLARWAPDTATSSNWQAAAEIRRERISEFCWNEELGIFVDYDHRNSQQSSVASVASFHPLWAGLATEEEAASVVNKLLPKLEHPFGISPSAPDESSGRFQWDHPNAWACMQHIVYRGLDRYGYHQAAQRIAEKYIECVSRTFEATGDLWEKYNVLDGTHHATEEAGYLNNPDKIASGTTETGKLEEPPSMMGWTAGVFMDAIHFLNKNEDYWLPSFHSNHFNT